VARVKHLYYDLRYAADNLEVQRRSLALADRLVEESRAQLRVGTVARLDLQAAESERASREEAVIVAEGALADAEDALKRSSFPDDEPGLWPLRLVAAARPSAEPVPLDVEAAVQVALDRRTDLRAARKALESADLSVAWARNQRLPSVDLIASYAARGLGGTEIVRQRLTGPILQEIRGGYGGALRDVWGRDFPAWSLEVSVARPFSNRQAEAAAARAGLDQEAAATRIRRLRLHIISEVRSAARAVETNIRRMASTRPARALQERRMEAEQKRFEAGLSTSFLVTQSQRDLAVAQAAELKATIDYLKSLVSFERAQEAGAEDDAGGSERR
jgi:outer membrane protein